MSLQKKSDQHQISIDNYNQFVEYSFEYFISQEKVWKIISKPSNLELFHPFCKENKVISWPGKNSIDELTYLNDKTLVRKFCFWKENKGYDLFIGRKNGRKSFVSWRLEPNSLTSGCRLCIRIYPHYYNTKKSILHNILFFLFIKPQLKKYLKSVLQGLNWYILNKKNISSNKFGKHLWFS